MGLYYKKNKIAGLNFLPRLTLAQYNALTVKPEYWIRTDSPDSYLMVSSNLVSFDNSGTIFVSNNVENTLKEISAVIARNGKPRFKNLGTAFTLAQQTALANGDYSDLQAGDYWVDPWEDNLKWVIVDDTEFYKGRGSGQEGTPMLNHHITVMPDRPLQEGSPTGAPIMNTTDTTEGGYRYCHYRNTGGGTRILCKSYFQHFFGSSHIAKHSCELSSVVDSNGRVSEIVWDDDCDVELPSAVNICGHNINGTSTNFTAISGSDEYFDVTGGKNVNQMWGQFSLFRKYPSSVISSSRQSYWLRDVTNSYSFARVSWDGSIDDYNASYPNIGARPFAFIV